MVYSRSLQIFQRSCTFVHVKNSYIVKANYVNVNQVKWASTNWVSVHQSDSTHVSSRINKNDFFFKYVETASIEKKVLPTYVIEKIELPLLPMTPHCQTVLLKLTVFISFFHTSMSPSSIHIYCTGFIQPFSSTENSILFLLFFFFTFISFCSLSH